MTRREVGPWREADLASEINDNPARHLSAYLCLSACLYQRCACDQIHQGLRRLNRDLCCVTDDAASARDVQRSGSTPTQPMMRRAARQSVIRKYPGRSFRGMRRSPHPRKCRPAVAEDARVDHNLLSCPTAQSTTLSTASWPGIAVRRTASLPLAYAPAIQRHRDRGKTWMPGTSPGMTAEQVEWPADGQITKNLSSPRRTNNSLFQNSDLSYKRITLTHERGGSRSSRNAGRDAVDAGGVGARGSRRAGRTVSDVHRA